MTDKRHETIARKIHDTAEAHHQAFAATEGVDPDWPIWYAEHLLDELNGALDASMTKSELIHLLVAADKEQTARAPGASWARYYAAFFLERYP